MVRTWMIPLALALGFALPALGAAPVEPADVVVFWAPFGGGHKSASKAIIKDVSERNPGLKVVMKDITDFLPPQKKEKALRIYEKFFSKHPELYNAMFQVPLAIGGVIQPDRLTPFMGYDTRALADWLAATKPSTIVSTFNVSSEVLVKLRRDRILNPAIPLAWMQTDFLQVRKMANISRWIDMTFVPHPDIAKAWVEDYGIDPDKVIATGIAVDESLSKPLSAVERRAFLESKGLVADRRTVVLMSGVNGVGDFPKIIRSIADASSVPVQIVAICGKNEEQLRAIQGLKLPPNAKLVAEGFSTEVPMYFKSADAIVTKAGGLTSAEVFTIGKPVVLLDNNGGQERYNIRFFEERDVARGTRDQGRVGEAVEALLKPGSPGTTMAEKQRQFVGTKDPRTAGAWVVESVERFRRAHPSGVATILKPSSGKLLRCLKWLEAELD
jgi:processive 1,2-diacylglycerol beta-glucosyltransferase